MSKPNLEMTGIVPFAIDERKKIITTQKEATQEVDYSQILRFGQGNCFWIADEALSQFDQAKKFDAIVASQEYLVQTWPE